MNRILFVLVILTTVAMDGMAQTLGDVFGSDKSLEKMLGGDLLEKQSQVSQLPKDASGLFSDRVIDAHSYRLGPYDVLAYSMWQPVNQMAFLSVNPDGLLVLPRIGEFHVAGRTLDSVRAELRSRLSERLAGKAEVSLSLYRPRSILVNVSGAIRQPGQYVVTAASRVNLAIQLANAVVKDQTPPSPVEIEQREENKARTENRRRKFGTTEHFEYSRRHITIRHNDGSMDNVDLLRYLATSDERWNPTLREGDQIMVDPVRLDAPTVTICGAVHNPGSFEYVPGDSLTHIVAMAYGVLETADLSTVQVQHVDASGSGLRSQTINLKDVLAGRTPDLALAAGDGVVVNAQVTRNRFGSVAVRGEVVHPGVYGIAVGHTTLGQVVRDAGGFTTDANVPAGIVERQLRGSDGREMDLRASTTLAYLNSPLTLEDTLNFNLQSRMRRGFVVVDFRKLFMDGDSTTDVALQDGDVIEIPQNRNEVYVFGQVRRPGYVSYVRGAVASFYVDKAGGVTESADPGRTGVIGTSTRTWIDASKAQIGPGDEVYVPKVSDIPATVREQSVGNILLAASAVASIAGVIINYVLFHK
jgi:polysaccharide export outer membrane protein